MNAQYNGMKPIFYAFACATLFFIGIPSVFAGEIQYGSLTKQYGDTLLLLYKGPSGNVYYSCTIADDCTKHGEKEPTLYPTVLGSTVYPTSADGTLAVKPFVLGTSAYYFLYDISNSSPKKKALIPYTKTGATIRITKNNTAVIFQVGQTYTRYDIASKKLTTLTLPRQLAFTTISPDGTYIAGYNYTIQKHELWRIDDGAKITGPSSMQSYLEFSSDEGRVAFLEDVKGFRTLFTMHTDDIGKASPSSLTQLTKPHTETEDYLYVGDSLYFIANVDGPLEWDLFAYRDGDIETVDTDVSYGDYLKRVDVEDTSYLAYLKVEGKNTDVMLLSSDGEKTPLTPVRSSSASKDITREVKTYGSRTGVLLAPENGRSGNLFIWMHGGPQRQVAKGYHPYLSYAVYDELLERLAEAGNYVFKIDYTGSSGYGADFRKALSMRVGDIEMRDIKNAIDDIEDDLDIENVYLIGNSYGGYMALRGIVDIPKKLDGAISINGVSDWYGLIQQIPSSPFISVFDGVPDSHNLNAYFQASVFTGLEDLTDDEKVLVVWGENDSTVPVWQSTKYVDFAKNLDVAVSTLSFSNEDHILRKRENLNELCETIATTFELEDVSCGN